MCRINHNNKHKVACINALSRVRLFAPHGLQPSRLLCPWDFPGKNTGVGCRCLLQGIFPTQGSNPGLPYCRQMLLPSEPPRKSMKTLNPCVVHLKLIQYCKWAILHLGNRRQVSSPADAAGPRGLAHNHPHRTLVRLRELRSPQSRDWVILGAPSGGGVRAVTPLHTPVGAGY